MRRLVLLSLGLSILFAAATAFTRVLGRPESSLFVGIFTNPDGSPCKPPCMFGIRPGETSINDGIAMLTAHPLTRHFTVSSLDPYRIEMQADRIIMITMLKTEDDLVDEITLSWYVRYTHPAGEAPPDGPLPEPETLGDIIALFGSPDFVQLISSGEASLAFVRANLVVNVPKQAWPIGPIQPNSQVSHLTLFSMRDCPANAFSYVFLQWQGLATFRRYVRANTVETILRPLPSAGITFAPCR